MRNIISKSAFIYVNQLETFKVKALPNSVILSDLRSAGTMVFPNGCK